MHMCYFIALGFKLYASLWLEVCKLCGCSHTVDNPKTTLNLARISSVFAPHIGPVLFHWSGRSDQVWSFFFANRPRMATSAHVLYHRPKQPDRPERRPLIMTVLPRPCPALCTFVKMASEGDVQGTMIIFSYLLVRLCVNDIIFSFCVIFVHFSSAVDGVTVVSTISSATVQCHISYI